jgi:ribosomal protein S30
VPTHGSPSKAGKVRVQTAKIEPTKNTSSSGPKVNNCKLFHNRVKLGRNIGQFKNGLQISAPIESMGKPI